MGISGLQSSEGCELLAATSGTVWMGRRVLRWNVRLDMACNEISERGERLAYLAMECETRHGLWSSQRPCTDDALSGPPPMRTPSPIVPSAALCILVRWHTPGRPWRQDSPLPTSD
jgi:hypothetical protein